MNELLRAEIVFDGRDVTIPSYMGTPAPRQMEGTRCEQLGELSGRICYDSLGTGRPSFSVAAEHNEHHPKDNPFGTGKAIQGYHDHIIQVKNFSVYEHF